VIRTGGLAIAPYKPKTSVIGYHSADGMQLFVSRAVIHHDCLPIN
jgi:hypothetical protein